LVRSHCNSDLLAAGSRRLQNANGSVAVMSLAIANDKTVAVDEAALRSPLSPKSYSCPCIPYTTMWESTYQLHPARKQSSILECSAHRDGFPGL